MSAAKRAVRRVLGLGPADGARTTGGSLRREQRRADGAKHVPNPFLRSAETSAARPADFEMTAPQSHAGALVGRWLLRGFLALMIVIGIWAAFVRPFISRADTAPAPAAALNTDAAGAAATRYALDYLSWSPGTANTARSVALSAATAGGTEAKGLSFTGSGYLGANAAVPAEVQALSNTSGVVTVDVRVAIAAPGKGVKALLAPPAGTSASTAAGTPAADAAPLPQGYQLRATLWLRLAVPVVQTDAGVKVAPTGPVFVGESAARPSSAAADLAADPAATSQTRDWINSFMTAYARSDTDYQSADGVTLTGLGSAVTVAEVASWALAAPDAAGTRVGTTAISWKLAAADLSITQTYTLGVTQDADRWYVTTIGPINPIGDTS